MERQYLDILPKDVQALVIEIEEACTLEIEVAVDPTRAKGLTYQPDPLACVIDESSVRILLPKPDYFPEGAVLHELLHARRFLVERVPQIVVCDEFWNDNLEQAYTILDNNLEHLIVVGEELSRRPDRRPHWVCKAKSVIDRVEIDNLPEIDRDITLLLVFALSKYVLEDVGLLSRVELLLNKLSLRARAEKYFAELVPLLGSKERATRLSFNHFRLPEDTACFQYIDTFRRHICEVSLSKTENTGCQ